MPGTRESFVELHCHTSASGSGIGKPPAVVARLKRQKYSAFSFTEHSNVDSLLVAREAARQAGIEFIPGIELSVRAEHPATGDDRVHLLGYFVEHSTALLDFCEGIREDNDAAAEEFLARLFARGIADISEENLREEVKRRCGEDDTWKHPLSPDVITSLLVRQEVIPKDGSLTVRQLFGELCPGMNEQLQPSLADGLAALREANATVVLAHPLGTAPKDPGADTTRALRNWLEEHVDGLEVYYGAYDTALQAYLYDIVSDMKRPYTGGSDTHIFDRPDRIRQSVAPYACVTSLKQFRSRGQVEDFPARPE